MSYVRAYTSTSIDTQQVFEHAKCDFASLSGPPTTEYLFWYMDLVLYFTCLLTYFFHFQVTAATDLSGMSDGNTDIVEKGDWYVSPFQSTFFVTEPLTINGMDSVFIKPPLDVYSQHPEYVKTGRIPPDIYWQGLVVAIAVEKSSQVRLWDFSQCHKQSIKRWSCRFSSS